MKCLPVCALLLLPGCLSEGSGGPTAGIATDLSSEDEQAWRKSGLKNVRQYRLSARLQSQSSLPPLNHTLPQLTLIALKGSGWTPARARKFAAHAPQRFAECGISLPAVRLITAEPGEGQPDGGLYRHSDARRMQSLLARTPAASDVIILLSKSIQDPGMEAAIGGTSVPHGRPIFAVIARTMTSGRRLSPEQVMAHEIGHLLGLTHTPARNADGAANVDLMQPRGCLYCRFSPEQCAEMKIHPLVRKTVRQEAKQLRK